MGGETDEREKREEWRWIGERERGRGERGSWISENWRGEGCLERKGWRNTENTSHSLSCLSVSQHSGTECSGFTDCTHLRNSCVKYT